jgi:polar amino acid transport system substrate-binding protein
MVAVVWMFGGVVFVAYYTAQLTTTLTVQQIRGSIEGPDDLPGKQIAALANSLAVDYLRAHNALLQTFERQRKCIRRCSTRRWMPS